MKRAAAHPITHLAFVAFVSLAAYAATLSRGFVSEDFTLLGFLSQRGFLANARIHLTGPLLGITFVPFYRPLSTMMLDLELHLWGTWPTGYLVTHFLLHLGNAAMLYGIVRRLSKGDQAGSGAPVAFAAALLFALYPLHPNTVVFIGSFANLFAATAGFASWWLFLRTCEGGGKGAKAGSLLCFVLALGSYEAAAVLPALFLAADVLARRHGPGWRLAVRHTPYFGILGAYLIVRQAVLGLAVGGGGVGLSALTGFDWARFFYPVFEPRAPEALRTTLGVLMALATLWSWARWAASWIPGDGEGPVQARLWLLGVTWVLIAQLPYRELNVVPGNGRFWYVSSAALGLLVASAAGTLAPRRWRGIAIVAVALVLGAGYFRLLLSYNSVHVEAGQTAGAIRMRLLEASSGQERLFLRGYPSYLSDEAATPVAQVYHWGLSDALRPPFTENDLRVYPLPPLAPKRLAPLLDRPDLGRVLSWDGSSLGSLSEDVTRPGRKIRVLFPADGKLLKDFRVAFEAPPAVRYSFVVLARGNPLTRAIPLADSPSGVVEAQLPVKFIDSMLSLYSDEIFWWIEALDEKRRPIASSELRTIRPGGRPSP